MNIALDTDTFRQIVCIEKTHKDMKDVNFLVKKSENWYFWQLLPSQNPVKLLNSIGLS